MNSVTGDEFDCNQLRSLELAEEAAILAERRLREAIDVLPEGIVFLDPDGKYILWNQRYSEIYAASADLLQPGARLADTLRIGVERGDYPESAGRVDGWITERLSLLENPGVRHEQRLADGRVIMIEERKTSDGGTIGLRVDITEMKQREDSFRLLFEDNPVPLLVYDRETQTITAANAAACQHFGYPKGQIEGIAGSCLFDEAEWDDASALLARDYSEKERFWHQRHRDGSRLESVLFTRLTDMGGRPATIVSVFDVTERRLIEARIAHMARHDELTGLANRAHCRERLREMLAARVRGGSVSVAFVDLDHFKNVNDTHGHHVGDQLLADAARRMAHLMPVGALLARIGGDEFAILFRNSSRDQIDMLAKAIIATLSEPFCIGDHVLHIGATVGIAAAPQDSDDAETLLRYADLALYSAKTSKRGTLCRFDKAMDVAAQEKARLESDFREAVQRGDLEVYYQPLINLECGSIEGYEALLRWPHAQRGHISPDVFIPLAEEMGLIEQIGHYVLHTACREAINWPDHVTLAVNVSPLQFRNGNLLNTVIQALAASRLPPARLELEITEAVLMDKGPRTLAIIHELRSFGIGLSMDDFGTGYSSLRYLLSYPFTKIKIDKSFVSDLEDADNSRAVIKAVIGLGRSLGMVVTAEGIEQAEVRDYLKAEGCEQGQGYLFGKARPAGEIQPELLVQKRAAG